MVRRKRRSDGAPFWGCPQFPQCRGTREINDTPPLLVADRAPALNRDRAGASAEREFKRRRARHAARIRSARPEIIVRGAVVAAIGLGLVVATPASWALLGLALLFVAVVTTVAPLVVLPQHVSAWDTGGEGERLTAAALESLLNDGFVVFHDRRIPMSVGNIDHIVVGLTGVWVIETKNYRGRIRVERGELRVNGRRRGGVFEEVEREGNAVACAVAPHRVKPLIVVHRADFQLFGWPNLRGVPVVNVKEAIKRIRRAPASLTPAEVAQIAVRIDHALLPALVG
jgi:hypothetical protein